MPVRNQNILVIGGSSGLGFLLSSALSFSNKVIITGRTNPKSERLEFRHLELCEGDISQNLDAFIELLPKIDIIVYAAGHYECGRLREMGDNQIVKMNSLYLLAPALLLSRILRKQNNLSGFIAVSSVSQFKPNSAEIVYCSVKAGFGMLANALALDGSIQKVLVVAPARINKNSNGGAREGEMGKLDAAWVVETILNEYEDDFVYKLVKITRNPGQIEIQEKRPSSPERERP